MHLPPNVLSFGDQQPNKSSKHQSHTLSKTAGPPRSVQTNNTTRITHCSVQRRSFPLPPPSLLLLRFVCHPPFLRFVFMGLRNFDASSGPCIFVFGFGCLLVSLLSVAGSPALLYLVFLCGASASLSALSLPFCVLWFLLVFLFVWWVCSGFCVVCRLFLSVALLVVRVCWCGFVALHCVCLAPSPLRPPLRTMRVLLVVQQVSCCCLPLGIWLYTQRPECLTCWRCFLVAP